MPVIVAEPKEEYEAKKLIAIPVINEVPAGYPEYPILDDYVQAYIYIPDTPSKAFGLYVRGDSMVPELNDNDIVIVNPAIRDFVTGEMGVFRLTTGTTVKYYYKDVEKAWLQPKNPKYPSIILTEEIECIAIGKVIWKIIKCI